MQTPWITVRTRRFSFYIDKRVPPVLLVLLVITLGAIVLSIGTGEYPIAPPDVVRTLLGLPTGNVDHSFIVTTLRVPRVLVAWMVGIALGVSGAIIQGLTRNPLAAPELTGVTAGASLAAVTIIVIIPGVPVALLPFAAFGGGVAVAGLLYLLAWHQGDSPIRLILVGIGLAAVLGAFTTFVITFGEINQVQRALIWLTGSVYGTTWDEVRPLVPWLLVCVPLALVHTRTLDALHLGEDIARGLGSAVTAQRSVLLLTAVALAAAVVTVAGTIGFVGLIAPHIARRLVGPAHAGVLPTAALTGGMLVVLSDLVGRTVFAPIEIPCGVITALIGAPFFMYLLYRHRNG